MKEKIKTNIKNLILLVSLYLVCQFFVIDYFQVSFADGGFFYALAATILISFLYAKRKNE